MRSAAAAAAVLAVLAGPTCNAIGNPSGRSIDDAHCDAVEGQVEREALPFRIFATVPAGDSTRWTEFETDEQRLSRSERDMLDEHAYAFDAAGRTVWVSALFQSLSGDWVHYASYCFREDGTLARIDSDLRTFYGAVRVIRVVAHDSSGMPVDSSESVFDLFTGEPADSAVSFYDHRVPVYGKTTDLPFAELLQESS